MDVYLADVSLIIRNIENILKTLNAALLLVT
jgi:hypothetical protein